VTDDDRVAGEIRERRFLACASLSSRRNTPRAFRDEASVYFPSGSRATRPGRSATASRRITPARPTASLGCRSACGTASVIARRGARGPGYPDYAWIMPRRRGREVGRRRWSENAQSAVRAFQPWLVEERQSSEWPGTRTAAGPARLLIYRFDSGLADRLSTLARRLCQWESPELPEDLCLFRSSGEPWLGSIAHERDAWLALTENEVTPVQAAIKPLFLRKNASR